MMRGRELGSRTLRWHARAIWLTVACLPMSPALAAAEDPAVDRGVLLPTAETQPGQTLTVTSYNLYLAGITYGVIDRLQLGAFGLLAPGQLGLEGLVGGSLKLQIWRLPFFHLSALASLIYAHETDVDRPGSAWEVSPIVGLVGSACLTRSCQALVSVNFHWTGSDDYGPATVLAAASGTIPVTSHLKIIAEYHPWDGLGTGRTYLPVPKVFHLVSLALRAHTRKLAFEAGGISAVDEGLAPFFFLSASYRLGSP